MTGSPQRWLRPASLAAAGFTTLCCLGVAAAVSLASSVGATFMTRDSSLKPLLAVTLTITVAVSALTFWRHRNPGPLLTTVLASLWIYGLVYVVGSGTHGDHDTMHHEAAHTGLSSGRQSLVWLGLVALVAAQLWEVTRIKRRRRSGPATVTAQAQASEETTTS